MCDSIVSWPLVQGLPSVTHGADDIEIGRKQPTDDLQNLCVIIGEDDCRPCIDTSSVGGEYSG